MRRISGSPIGWLVVVAIVAVACGTLGSWLGRSFSRPGRTGSSTPIVAARGDLAADEMATIGVFEATRDAVVFITTLERQRTNPFSFNVLEQPRGTGSGFVWDAAGHVVTNYHVVAEGDAFQVRLADHQAYEARLVGVAPSKDIAVLRITAPALTALSVGTSADLRVGQQVFAIGNPFGLDHSLTTGVVSALGREIKALDNRTITDVIQTDAAINPGNSGGPLLDSAGRLIGVNTAIFSPSGANAGIGFAVPVDVVRRVVPQFIEFGRVIRPGLGVMLVPDAISARLDLPGPMIGRVVPDGPADRAGLRGVEEDMLGRIDLGDVILAIDGVRVRNHDELLGQLEKREAGDEVAVQIQRGGARQEIHVRLSPDE